MLENWDNATISKVKFAVYIGSNVPVSFHPNRPDHGFIINTSNCEKNFIFDDGTILKTKSKSIYYLPKGSTYRVEYKTEETGCWAINFFLTEDFDTKPFVLNVENSDSILELFKESVEHFKKSTENSQLIIKKNLYDIIIKIRREHSKIYLPNSKFLIIKPAIDNINSNFTDNNLSIKKLSQICGISENYFRRIFHEKFDMSPKEYIIKRRIDYAKVLLESGQFSVTEVSDKCGYFEPCQFSREFSKKVGVSPSKYKMLT